MKNKIYFGLIAVIFFACVKNGTHKKGNGGSKNGKQKALFTPDPMPSILASGQAFPVDKNTLNGWIKKSKVVNNLETNPDIITHGWDIWAALTDKTKQKLKGQTLRRFETWYTPGDIINALKAKSSNKNFKLTDLARIHQGILKKPHQHHGLGIQDSDVTGFVKYDPSSANHIYTNELYYFQTLQAMAKKNEIANIPPFPATSVIIKPVFQALDYLTDSLYALPVWPGYDSTSMPMDSVLANGFGPPSWGDTVKISLKGKSDSANNIFPIDDFIHFKLDKEQADNIFSVTGDNHTAKAGDYAVLVGMHVNSRENRRWTWQTFWWSKNPSSPHSPSSDSIASLQPTVLDNAAKHYAMALAYNMVWPAQPVTGGSNAVTEKGQTLESVYAFNPYLEAGFNSATFDLPAPTGFGPDGTNSGGNPYIKAYYPEGYQRVGALLSNNMYIGGKLNRVGIQTNCMSCHGQARIYQSIHSKEDAAQLYITDQYYDLNAPYFQNSVVLDFVWSIQGNLMDNPDSVKTQ